MIRFLGFCFAMGCCALLVVAVAAGVLTWQAAQDLEHLPSVEELAQYRPPVLTRIHAANGAMLAEYAEENRVLVPISQIPKPLIGAFLSAEDKTFYEHGGFDWLGIGYAAYQAAMTFVQTGKLGGRGASTISQQVAKNFFLTPERSVQRKIKEALLTVRLERTFSKDKILELYLNRIFLGNNAHGVGAAALAYFGRSLDQLTLGQMAYLASLPKAPSTYNLSKRPEKAITRRNWVLSQMVANGYITPLERAKAEAEPLEAISRVSGAQVFRAEFFAEEVRRRLADLYGTDVLYKEGLSVRTTLDPKMQIQAKAALVSGLVRFDQKTGWRGPVKTIPLVGDFWASFDEMPMPEDLEPWRLALVTALSAKEASIAFQKSQEDEVRGEGRIPLKALTWARPDPKATARRPLRAVRAPSDVLAPGDVVYVTPLKEQGDYALRQIPQVQGALVAMDPHTGRVLAMVGGFSYGKSQFNRAVQALRQPGSAIKPFVYAAALDHGYTPSSLVMDGPIAIALPNGKVWRPENYTRTFYGPSTLRIGLEKSRNAMTVNLAHDMGIERFVSLVERLGIYDTLAPLYPMVLGAGETTLLKMTTAYAVLANGGRKIEPTLIDRIQDRFGRTVFRHDQRVCHGCGGPYRDGQEPIVEDKSAQILDPYTAYQMTLMLEGVVERGTGKALKRIGRPVAGKTGTSNEERDAWFMGYTPDLVVGTYIGYDTPKPMGKHGAGGELAAPIVADFMADALKDEPIVPFRVPPGIQLIPIHSKTGERGAYGDPDVILEAFKPGQQPGSGEVIGAGTPDQPTDFYQNPGDDPFLGEDSTLDTGTGGLY